ncbi:MAG: hypothetical protein JRG73_19085 [Deltaproteobacteria bacterium]|nr:hypothetical protein [Deltaproteobacteria bacterium]MBW2309033.1 hypothetical protein [Deltaproteobacteria bacterium]
MPGIEDWQVFTVEMDDDRPAGFCKAARHGLYPEITELRSGRGFPWMKKTRAASIIARQAPCG